MAHGAAEAVRSRLGLTGRYYRQYPADEPLGEAEERVELPLDASVLLLVDVYGKGYDPDHTPPDDLPSFYRMGPDDPRGKIVRELIAPAKASAKQAGLRVVYLTNYLSP